MADVVEMATAFRSLERIIIVLGGMLFAYLGYKLYLKGVEGGDTEVEMESDWMELVVTGQGLGLAFMACGAITLVAALVWGGVEQEMEVSGMKTYSSGN